MNYEWGPWIDHDGQGCPNNLVGSIVRISIQLACADRWGGGEGHIRFQETRISPDDLNNPMWEWENFGKPYHYTSGPYAGENFYAGRILRYQIRQFSAMRDLKELAANPKEMVIS